MNLKRLPFRQIHLDFHTSPAIPAIGAAFDKKEWQDTLREARIESITCFSKCHHGLSYHPTRVGVRHPHLEFDLLRMQIDACREIGVQTPIYLSAGIDNTASSIHPEWREIDKEGRYGGWSKSPLEPGFHKLCFNTPYLDYLCRQIEEAVTLFPEADGVFLDIVFQGECCCNGCLEAMRRDGLDAGCEEDRRKAAQMALERYYKATGAACKIADPAMPVFHNSGHIRRGRRDLLAHQSHLELESLPTGGWGYDHFPESASYAAHLGRDYLGMTGKFHTTWGEFGGFKHPDALRYECASMLTFGAKCSVGDQLHPCGRLDASTYKLIGAAYRQVEAKEPWCRDSEAVADIGVLSAESEIPQSTRDTAPDTGAARVLLEGHQLFALIDREADFSPYRLLILPDVILIDVPLEEKINAYLAAGGKLLLTGRSGLRKDGDGFACDIGAIHSGTSPFQPDYVLPEAKFRASFVASPFVMYQPSERIKAIPGRGKSLGQVFDPYFNRTFRQFCSHQHAPSQPESSGYDCGVRNGDVIYLAHPVFSIYRDYGSVVCREYVLKVIRSLLGEPTVQANLPADARLTFRRQPERQRQIVHLLYASKSARGYKTPGGKLVSASNVVEVIEELVPLHRIHVSLASPTPVSHVTLEPQGRVIPHSGCGGRVKVEIDSFTGHQMIVFHRHPQ